MSSIADARKIAAMRAMAGKEFESPETLAKMTARASGAKVPLPERPIGQQVEQELAAAPPEPRKGDSIMSQEGRLKEVGATGMVPAARRAAAQRAFLKEASPWGSAEMAYEGGKNVVSGVEEGSPKKVAVGAAQGALGTGMLGLDMAGLGLLIPTGTGPLLKSKLAEAVASLKPGQKIATQGLRDELTKRGVRKAEMNATQLDSLVKAAEERGQKSISKEEILEHIEETPVGITEIARGRLPETPEVKALADEVGYAWHGGADELLDKLSIPTPDVPTGSLKYAGRGGPGYTAENLDWNQIKESPEKLARIWPEGWEKWYPEMQHPTLDLIESDTRKRPALEALNRLDKAYGGYPSGSRELAEAGDELTAMVGRSRGRFESGLRHPDPAKTLWPGQDVLEQDVIQVTGYVDKALEGLRKYREAAQNTVDRTTLIPEKGLDTAAIVDDLKDADQVLGYYADWPAYKAKLLAHSKILDEIRGAPAWQKYVDANKRLKEAKSTLNRPTKWEHMGAHAPGGENYGETTLHLETKALKDEPYMAAHWTKKGEENAVVHFRHTDRVDEQGRRILFVDEIQSDWHQQGRLRGYSPEENAAIHTKLLLENKKLADALRQAKNEAKGWSLMAQREVSPIAKTIRLRREQRALALYATIHKKADIVRNRLRRADMGPVPEGMFKGTKEWTGLAIKRIMRKAAEEGYQGVAFTRGKDAMKYSRMKPEGAYYYDTIVPSVAAKIAAPKGVSKVPIEKTIIKIPQAPGEVTSEEFPVVWLTDAVKGRAMLPYDKFAAVLAAGAAGAAGAKALQDRKGEEEQ